MFRPRTLAGFQDPGSHDSWTCQPTSFTCQSSTGCQLNVHVQASELGVNIHAKGDRADEVLLLDLALPLLPASTEVPLTQQPAAPGSQPAHRVQHTPAHTPAGMAGTSVPAGPGGSARAAAAASTGQQPVVGRLPAGAVEGSSPSWGAEHDEAAQGQVPAAAAGLPQQRGGGELVLRGGQLMLAANVDATGSQLDLKVCAPHGNLVSRMDACSAYLSDLRC